MSNKASDADAVFGFFFLSSLKLFKFVSDATSLKVSQALVARSDPIGVVVTFCKYSSHIYIHTGSSRVCISAGRFFR